MEGWIRDLTYASRRLRSRPLYTLLTVMTLALGVGGTAAIYSIVQGLLVKPLPYHAEEGIAQFWAVGDWTEQEFLYLRPNMPGFQKVAAYRNKDVTLELGTSPARLLLAVAASAELFEVLGAGPSLGRAFHPGDDAIGSEPVIVLSYGMWRELGGEPSIIGQRLKIDGVQRTVVGVMPKGFWFPDPTVQAWLPAQLDPANRVGNYALMGRIAPGLSINAMSGPLSRITATLGQQFQYGEQWDKTRGATLTPIRDALIGSLRPALLATMVAMALILLIACANVAALMLSQAESRSSEFALRSALGADQWRLTRQLIIESLLIGSLAGVVGAALAASGFGLLVRTLPLGEWGTSTTLDWTLFAAAMAIAVLAALGIALVPAMSLRRGDLRDALTRLRLSGIGGRGSRMESGLVVVEIALAVLMTAGAGLLVRSVNKLYAIDPGLNPKAVAVLDVALPAYQDDAQKRLIIQTLLGDLQALPGVRSVSLTAKLPLRGPGWSWGIQVEGRPDLPQSTTYFRIVGPGYFTSMGIKVRAGRGFDGIDRPDGERVVVINEALAKKYFEGVDPLGRLISTGFGGSERIVGIVENVAEANLPDTPEPARYMLYDQVPFLADGQTFVLRMRDGVEPSSVLEPARKTIQRASAGVAIQDVTTMDRVFAKAVGAARQIMMLLSLLTALALVLGAIGVYGMISHFVNRRKRDLGIRMALGLSPSRVIGQVLRRGVGLVSIGIGVGLVGAIVGARLLTSLLYGVSASDPLALAIATMALLLVGLLSAVYPAYRASRVDLNAVLREQ